MSARSFIRTTFVAAALASTVAFSAPAFAADASMDEVYQAAKAGKYTEAQAMMDKVLQDHPNSGKAHFVEAELLAKQGKFAAAKMELSTAQRLAPGLPFAKPAAVQNLQNLLNDAPNAQPTSRPTSYAPQQQQAPSGGVPWGLLIVGVGLIGFIVFAVKFMGRRNNPTYSFNGGNGAPQPGMQPAMQGYGNQYGAPAMGPGMGGGLGGGGIGSGIVGGLATGAALGAGMVAGEALVHHFTDGDRNSSNNNFTPAPAAPDNYDQRLRNDDMGGNDFGVSDSSSWDDSSSGGGGGDDSWN